MSLTPLLFYVIIGIMMLGSFVIGFLFGSMKTSGVKKSSVSKEVEQMAAKVLEVEQKLNAVQQRVEISDIENSNQVRVVKTSNEEIEESTISNNRMAQAANTLSSNKTSKKRDNLQLITGIGPALEDKLNDIGYYSYEQLAQLTDEEAESIADQLNLFSGRIHRDNWMQQAMDLNNDTMQKSNA